MAASWETNFTTWDQIGDGSQSSTFINLVNKVLKRLNEVEISNETQFLTVTGFHSHAKDAVNNAIRDINSEQVQWPFNHVRRTQVLVPGRVYYNFPVDTKIVDFDTFRLKRDDTLKVRGQWLRPISYEDYIRHYRDRDEALDDPDFNIPRFVYRTQDNNWGVSPPPDKPYTVEFEYFRQPTTMVMATDTTTLPEQYESIIEDGAMYYLYMFRENTEAAQLAKAKFDDGIKQMRTVLINRDVNVTSTYIQR